MRSPPAGGAQRPRNSCARLGIDFDYTYVDLLEGNEQDEAMKMVEKWNPSGSFPTLVINDRKCIVGFREKEIREALGV